VTPDHKASKQKLTAYGHMCGIINCSGSLNYQMSKSNAGPWQILPDSPPTEGDKIDGQH